MIENLKIKKIDKEILKAIRDNRVRILQNKRLFELNPIICDFHSHSIYSDGTATIKELHRWQKKAGIDFLVVTDHNTLAQKSDCQQFADMYYGIEISNHGHHIIALGLEKEMSWTGHLAQMVKKVKEKGGLPIVIHPVGWYKNLYPVEKIAEIEKVNSPFIIEIANAAGQFLNYWDVTDQETIKFWDRLLSKGKRVIGVAGSDSHIPIQLGEVYNGVLAQKLTTKEIMKALTKGNLFVTNGPFALLRCKDCLMGARVRCVDLVELELVLCDNIGLEKALLISEGKVVQEFTLKSKKKMKIIYKVNRRHKGNTYYRLEVYSVDGKRCYTNPIWIERG